MHKRSVVFWDITRRWVAVLYRRFGTTYRSYFQGSRSQRQGAFFLFSARRQDFATRLTYRRQIRQSTSFLGKDMNRGLGITQHAADLCRATYSRVTLITSLKLWWLTDECSVGSTFIACGTASRWQTVCYGGYSQSYQLRSDRMCHPAGLRYMRVANAAKSRNSVTIHRIAVSPKLSAKRQHIWNQTNSVVEGRILCSVMPITVTTTNNLKTKINLNFI
jgi:hypothetical protein